MSKPISAKTRAEMYAGSARVGGSRESVDAQIVLAEAWGKVADWERDTKNRFPKGEFTAKAMVWQNGHELTVEPFIRRDKLLLEKHTVFPREPVATFPSPTLMAQIALVLG